MGLGYPTTSGSYESQQFGPVPPTVPGVLSQPTMWASGSVVAWYQPYKGWTGYLHYHNGLDVAGPEGLALRALETGKVVYRGWKDNGGGYVIEVEIRPGVRYTFNHCSGFATGISVGSRVARGQIIAYIGSTGMATGNHCHLSLDMDEQGPDGVTRRLAWNPKLFMAGGAYATSPRIQPLTAAPAPAPSNPVVSSLNTEADNVMAALRYRKDSGTITIKAGKPYRKVPTVDESKGGKPLGYFDKNTTLRKIGKPKQLTGSYDPWVLTDVYRGNGDGLVWVTAVDKV